MTATAEPLPVLAEEGEPPPPPLVVDEAPVWPAWQRVLFRYLLCHGVLYALPGPFDSFFGQLARGLSWLAWKLDQDWLRTPASWAGDAVMYLAQVRQSWDRLVIWLTDNGLTPLPATIVTENGARIVNPSGSGDTAADFTRLGVIVLVSLVVTIVWTLLSRASAYPRLGRWLHLYARWYLAFAMLGYGLHKVYGGQFGGMELGRLTQEVGDKSGMGMVWLFMAGSRPYEWFGALGEVAGGLLLLHHRTALLGALVTIGVMANVCALNWLYDVPVKQYSTHLLLFAVCLLGPYRERLWALLIANRVSMPVDLRVVRQPVLAWLLVAFGGVWIAAHLTFWHHDGMQRLAANERRFGPKPELYGVWRVEKMLRDGVEVGSGDATRWRSVALDRGPRLLAREVGGRAHMLTFREDLAAGSIHVQRQNGAEQVWTVERGHKVAKVLNPDPQTMADYNKMVDVELPWLVLKGRLDDQAIELHLVMRYFPLFRPFRLVQEMPYNR